MERLQWSAALAQLAVGVVAALAGLWGLIFPRGMGAPAALRASHIAGGLATTTLGGIVLVRGLVALQPLVATPNRESGSLFPAVTLVLCVLAAGACLLWVLAMQYTAGRIQSTDRLLNQLQTQVHRDGLTGLLNRIALFRYGADLQAQAGSAAFAVIMIDLDNFKAHNDRHGHLAGDELLQAAAWALRQGTREHDQVARYGGDEFTVVVAQLPLETVLAIARRLARSIAHLPIGRPGVMASVGVAWGPADHAPFDAFVADADRCLYRAKRRGGNQVEWVDISAAPARLEAAAGAE